MVPRVFAPMLMLAVLVSVGAPPMSARPASATEQPDIPLGVLVLLPPGSELLSASPAALVGTDQADWVLLYTTPNRDFWIGDSHFSISDAHVAVIVPGPEGWMTAKELTIDEALGPSVELPNIAGSTAVAFHAFVGAHSAKLVVVRWDGLSLTTVFDDLSNSASLEMKDIDGDGIPEVVNLWAPDCESHADSPHLITLYKWDGASYTDYPGTYPSALLRSLGAELRDVFPRAANWSAYGQACLYASLGYLAAKAGDAATAAVACRRARLIYPNFDHPTLCR